jgi:hypothetical protein
MRKSDKTGSANNNASAFASNSGSSSAMRKMTVNSIYGKLVPSGLTVSGGSLSASSFIVNNLDSTLQIKSDMGVGSSMVLARIPNPLGGKAPNHQPKILMGWVFYDAEGKPQCVIPIVSLDSKGVPMMSNSSVLGCGQSVNISDLAEFASDSGSRMLSESAAEDGKWSARLAAFESSDWFPAFEFDFSKRPIAAADPSDPSGYAIRMRGFVVFSSIKESSGKIDISVADLRSGHAFGEGKSLNGDWFNTASSGVFDNWMNYSSKVIRLGGNSTESDDYDIRYEVPDNLFKYGRAYGDFGDPSYPPSGMFVEKTILVAGGKPSKVALRDAVISACAPLSGLVTTTADEIESAIAQKLIDSMI